MSSPLPAGLHQGRDAGHGAVSRGVERQAMLLGEQVRWAERVRGGGGRRPYLWGQGRTLGGVEAQGGAERRFIRALSWQPKQ